MHANYTANFPDSYGIHAYLHLDTHPTPLTWNANWIHDDPATPGNQPRGIIEVVPEPATLTLIALGGAVLLRRR
jgi:hypothetical protein